ncbi:extracellular solute-binding protein [Desertihabitans aurantiacus]|uniref:extracellular solute-binding protein n=1 Tax=Desertihabitans aurantiacus TaxID=2282477 RepID=UPI001E5FE454|nr:extracellular solute-binding protein [Desertihabitans aurantiacus]
MSFRLSRRSALTAGALGLAAVSGLTSGCQQEQDAGQQQQLNEQVELPTYTKLGSVQPELPGDDILLDGFLRYPADPTRISDGPPGDGQPISFMSSIPTAIPPGLEQNAYWQEMNARVGSELQLALTSDGYADKFATTVAGGDLPDVVYVPTDVAQLPRLMEAKFHDLTELLSGDAVAEYPALANLSPDLWRGCVFNGRIWGIPVPRAMARTSNPLYRADLVEAKGITNPAPTDFADFLALCQELTDTRSNKWAWDAVPIQYIQGMLGIANNWSEQDGAFTRSYEQEAYAQSLEAGRQMVEAGVVNPDGFSTGTTARKQWINGGTCIFARDSFVAWNQFYTDNLEQEGFEIRMLDTPGFDGGEGVIWMGSALNNITSFNKESAHDITTLLKVADFMAAPFGTAEYLFKKYGVEGQHHELQGTDPILNKRGSVESGLGLQYFADPPMALYLPGRPDVVEAQYATEQAFKPKLVFDASYGLYSDTASSQGKQIDGVLSDLQTQILLGEEPVSAWAEAVDTWRRDGGDQIRGELEQAFATAHG